MAAVGPPAFPLPPPPPTPDQAWLANSPLLDLEDPKLRLRAQSLVQLCKTEREKALAVYASVKRIPFGRGFKMRLHTAREVLQQPQADAADKATLLVALLRLAGIPARIRYLTLSAEVLRGLGPGLPAPMRPVVEMLREGRWLATDTYMLDASYLAAARRHLAANGWTHGFGVHARGSTLWDGAEDAFLGLHAPEADPMVLQDHGVFCDPLEFVSSPQYRIHYGRVSRTLHWNLLSPRLERAIRSLRQAPLPAPAVQVAPAQPAEAALESA